MSRNIVTGIDIRSDKVVCLIAHELEIVNHGTFLQLIGHGIVDLPIDCVDPFHLHDEMLKKYIKQAIDKAEVEASVIIEDAYISVNGHIESMYINKDTNLENEIVTKEVIHSFFKSNHFKTLYTDKKEPIHSFPISYKINQVKSVSDPIGMTVNNLRVKWHIIMSDSEQLNRLRIIFEELNISIRQFIANVYASSMSTLLSDESSQGAVVIDVGKNNTFINFVFDNNLISSQKIPVGTHHISKDISQIMNLELSKADILRKKLNTSNESQLKDQFEIDSHKVFNSRCEELSELIQKIIKESKYFYLVDKNIIITGKGSKSSNLVSRVKNKFGSKKVRLGVAQKFNGLKTIISNPSLASSFGLLTYDLDHDLQIDETNIKENKKKSIFSAIYNFFRSI